LSHEAKLAGHVTSGHGNAVLVFTGALRKYFEFNKKLPNRVIVFRDGVGDGQLDMVVNYEVRQFIDCLKENGRENYRCWLCVCRCT